MSFATVTIVITYREINSATTDNSNSEEITTFVYEYPLEAESVEDNAVDTDVTPIQITLSDESL